MKPPMFNGPQVRIALASTLTMAHEIRDGLCACVVQKKTEQIETALELITALTGLIGSAQMTLERLDELEALVEQQETRSGSPPRR